MTQCTAIRPNGERCRATALPDRPQCFAHDPANRERANAARRAGGHNRSSTVRAARRMPANLKDVAARLLVALEETYTGDLEPDRARAMASLAGAVCRVYEVGEVEQRIADLEARLEARPQQARRY